MADETTTRAPSHPIDFSAPVTSAPPSGVRAAAPSATCAKCAAPITGYYYENAGAVYCPQCKRLAEEASGAAASGGGLGRATLFGLGAAIVGAFGYWAFVKITDFEWALVSIAVGILVATAIRKANGNRGGRRFQILAVVLTYLAIGGAYVPFELEGASEGRARHAASTPSDRAGSTGSADAAPVATVERDAASAASAASEAASGDARASVAPRADAASSSHGKSVEPKQMSVAAAIPLFLGAVVVLALVGPVLIIFGGMPGSIINVLIIGFALRRAWQMTAAGVGVVRPTFTGPYNVRSRPAPIDG